MLKGKDCNGVLYPERLSFRTEGEIKFFPDKQKLKKFSTTKPDLQKMLKDFLKLKKKCCNKK